jgi:CBS domain-containing protein
MKIQVKEFMSAPVVTTTPDSNVAYVRELMERKGVNAIPVVEMSAENISVRGIVTTSDLLGVTDESKPVREVMSTNIRVITPEITAGQAANIMTDQDIHHLVVMENGRLTGMVSSMDFVRLVSEKKLRSFASVIFV